MDNPEELIYCCECCGYARTSLPFVDKRPASRGLYRFCQQCWDAGCSGPPRCAVSGDDARDDVIPVSAAEMAYVYESLGITPRDPEEETQ